jgi:hypothetical protein
MDEAVAMIGEPKPSEPAGGASAVAEDTVEFELTAEQQLALWQAAGDLAGPADRPPAPSPYDAYICRRTDRIDRVCTIAFATVVLGLTVATGWHAMGDAPAAPAVVVRTTTAANLAPALPQRAPVVQVLNPFDPTEVFELPASTTESDARNAIAELLLQRARERFRQGFNVHRANNRHTAAPATSSLDVFVTRISGTEDRIGDFNGLTSERAAAD